MTGCVFFVFCPGFRLINSSSNQLLLTKGPVQIIIIIMHCLWFSPYGLTLGNIGPPSVLLVQLNFGLRDLPVCSVRPMIGIEGKFTADAPGVKPEENRDLI